MKGRTAQILSLLAESVKKKVGVLHPNVNRIYTSNFRKSTDNTLKKRVSKLDHEKQLAGLYKQLIDMHPNRLGDLEDHEVPGIPDDYHKSVSNIANRFGVNVQKEGNNLKISGGNSSGTKTVPHPKNWKDHNKLVSHITDQKDGDY